MSKLKSLKFFIVFALFLCLPFFAQAKSWHFEKWLSEITVNQDSTFTVAETQTVDFQGSFTWIQRDIAIKRFKKISEIAVYDEDGVKLAPGATEISRGIGKVSVKINFEARDEKKTWTIAYKISGGIGFFRDYDELYWNAVSEDRNVAIDVVEVLVRLPQSVSAENLKQRLFVGPAGSKDETGDFEILDHGVLRYFGKNIAPYENFTIAAGWPKGIVARDFWGEFGQYFWFILPVAAFIFLFNRWMKVGRDPKMKGTIVPHYAPPEGISPAEMGALIHEKFAVRDISASLVDLARRGYLKIREIEKRGILTTSRSYQFTLRKDFLSDNNLKAHEQLILQAVFGGADQVSLEDLENKFYREIPPIRNAVLQSVVAKGYFKQNPSRVIQKYIALGIAVLVLAGIAFYYLAQFLPSLAIGLAGILIVIFGRFMPARTEKGAEAAWQTLGFKMYLSVAERFRLQANVDPKTFEKYLAYAMVLGVERAWAKRFADIYREPPDWYMPVNAWTAFSLASFSSDLSTMSNSFSSVLSSSPSSSSGFGGGGFSGGGGGGGGSSAG
ncbi:MAG: DUF2207 domain-containing protein [bacterium]|nr:DUF2207 domain-containing protein [bacterium]